MPELPEVETIRRQILPYLPCRVESVTTSSHFSKLTVQAEFPWSTGEILSLNRHGKWLIFKLAEDQYIVGHLGMSGGLRLTPVPLWGQEKHLHLQMKCHQGDRIFYLSYIDPRRFGKFYFLRPASLQALLERLGPDGASENIDEAYLHKVFQRHPHKMIKPFLLEQKYFAGLGNYLACEVCARAGLRPTRRLEKITAAQRRQVAQAIKQSISEALKNQGTTFGGGYRDTAGKKGEGLMQLVVFHQERCQLCQKTKIKKIFLQGRGTYYCPRCQR
jgi:formamidopyrimidine-DNA glycosylase